MGVATLASMMERVRQLADLEDGGAFIADAELIGHINRACWQLDDILQGTWEGYFTKEVPVTLSGTSHALPADFYKLVGVDIRGSRGEWVALRQYAEASRNSYRNARPGYAEDVRYQLRAASLAFLPGFASPTEAFLLYYPQLPAMVAPTDSRDYPNGWEQWAVIQAAILCLTKEERDTGPLERLLALEDKRVRDAAPVRNMEQLTISDIRRDSPTWDPSRRGRW